MNKDEKEMKEHLNKYDKDTLIELYLQAKFDEKVKIAELEEELLVAKSWMRRAMPEDYAEIKILRNVNDLDGYIKFVLDDFYIINERKIRHEICEKIRNFMTQDSCLTKEELIECLESFTAKSIFQLLDEIERGEE